MTHHATVRLSGTAVLAALLLCACSSPLVEPKPDEDRVHAFATKGYQPDNHYAIEASRTSWTIGAASYDVAIVTPAGSGVFPLVVFLPGLSQNAAAGVIFREAWAKNGYAVLSVQPLAVDTQALARDKVKGRDLTPAVRERYGSEAMTQRIEALQAVIDEALRRRAAGETPFQRIDFDHVALAGFDLGAYTAMILGGEHSAGPDHVLQHVKVRAVIAFSPYATFSGSTFASRYTDVRVPVLSVTSDIDADPIGLVSSPSVRGAPFRFMPATDKYLLTFYGLPHLVLSGNVVTAKELEPTDEDEDHVKRSEPSRSRGSLKTPAANVDTSLPATERAIDVSVIQSVSTAFLDTALKSDTIAREWLEKNTVLWLGSYGTFQRR